MKKAFTLAIVAFFLIGASGKPTPTFVGRSIAHNDVEQQGHIENPTPCMWDADDWQEKVASGVWPPGYSTTTTICVVGDWTEHAFVIGTTDSRLTVSFSTETGPSDVTCAIGPDYDHSYPLPPVGDGVGIIETVTFTVRNDSGSRVGTPGRPVHVVAAGYPSYFMLETGRGWLHPWVRDVCPDFWSMPRIGTYPGPWWRW